MNRKRLSHVWEHVTKYSNGKISLGCICIRCTALFSLRASSGIIKAHMNSHGYFHYNSKQNQFIETGALLYIMPASWGEQQAYFEKLVVE